MSIKIRKNNDIKRPNLPDVNIVEKIANELSDRVYGEEKKTGERITIIITSEQYDKLESLSRYRRKKKLQNKSMSSITRHALELYLDQIDSELD